MKKIAEETELLTEESRRDRRGRVLLSEDRWKELLTGYERSNQTQRDYCVEHGVNVHTFVARLAKWRRETSEGEPGTGRFLEAKLPMAVFSSASMEVVMPNGLLVRGSDPASLLTMVRALMGGH